MKDEILTLVVSALQQISRGHQCKRPLPALEAQRLAKSALRYIDLDWVGRTGVPIIWEAPRDGSLWHAPSYGAADQAKSL